MSRKGGGGQKNIIKRLKRHLMSRNGGGRGEGNLIRRPKHDLMHGGEGGGEVLMSCTAVVVYNHRSLHFCNSQAEHVGFSIDQEDIACTKLEAP